MKPYLGLLAAEMGALATMLWLLPASAHIVSWPSGGPVRIAYLAPLSRLYLAVIVSALIFGGLAAVTRTRGKGVDSLAHALAPLLCLWFWLVPFLPWLPDRAPLLLLLAGPLRWVIAAVALAGLAVRSTALQTRIQIPRLHGSVVFLVSLAFYAALGLRSMTDVGFGGDEPHYLIITHSLVADGDLDIANNHERRDYRSFFPGDLRPDFLRRGVHGEIYSIHGPGLPVLLVPAYAAFGARGAVVFIALLAALTALAVFDLASTLAGPAIGAVTWAATCLTVPFVPHAWLIYPELPGALVVAWAAAWLFAPPASARTLIMHGLALAVLPWLHTKFVVFVAAFAFFELIRLWPAWRRAASLFAPIAVSGLVWLLSFYWMYGEFNPEAPYGSYTRMFVLAANIPRGVLGLLFDQKFGLLAFSPVYLLALGGAWVMLRDPRSRVFSAELLLTAIAFFVSTTRLYMWWGGSSPPARFLVPMVPLLAPMIAVAISRARTIAARTVVVSTIVLTLAMAVAGLGSPGESLLFSDPHGVSSLVTLVQGSAPLDVSLPTFTEENWRAPLWTLAPWVLAVAIGAIATLLALRRGWLRSVFWAATTAGVAVFTAAALIFGVRSVPNRQTAVLRGQLSMLNEYDPTRLRAVDVTHRRRLDATEVLDAATLAIRRGPDDEIRDPRVLEGPFELPEGAYRARVWFTGDRPPAAEAFVGLSDQVQLARAAAPLTNPAVLNFELPVRTPAFIGVNDAAAARAVNLLEIAPASVVPRSLRDAEASHVVEPVGGDISGFMAYADRHTYPENGVFWTRDTERGSVVIVTGGASTLRLVLHVGPTGGVAALDVGGHTMSVDLKPDETRELSFPLLSGTKRVTVSAMVDRSFRPADVDPRSDDRRLLGCQVRPLLF